MPSAVRLGVGGEGGREGWELEKPQDAPWHLYSTPGEDAGHRMFPGHSETQPQILGVSVIARVWEWPVLAG